MGLMDQLNLQRCVVFLTALVVVHVASIMSTMTNNLKKPPAIPPTTNEKFTKMNPHPSFKPFNTTNPHPKFCPIATCNNSPICSPCNRRYLFILATPRSGSTTMLTTLNQLPGVRLSGENPDVFVNFWKTVGGHRSGNFTQMSHLLNSETEVTAGAHMHNAIPKQSMACTAQQFINTINPPPRSVQQNANVLPLSQYDSSTIMGAKMIRVQRGNWGWRKMGPINAAKFIKTYFPCSKVIVNIRKNLRDQVLSINTTFVARKHAPNEFDLRDQNNFLECLAGELGKEHARILHLEEWSKNKKYLNNLVKWIGFHGCELKHILHDNKGEDGYEQDKIESPLFGSSCRYLD